MLPLLITSHMGCKIAQSFELYKIISFFNRDGVEVGLKGPFTSLSKKICNFVGEISSPVKKLNMERRDAHQVVYDQSVIDFVAVAVEFCVFIENDEQQPRAEWIEKMLKMMPLLYVKASLLPETVVVDEEPPATFVREEDYTRVTERVAGVMGAEDVYLDVFVDDMKYSDRPISAFISENIADIYQDVRNFVSVYQFELTDQMNEALHTCRENFHLFWGQKLVNVLRPLHALKSRGVNMDLSDRGDDLNEEALWDQQ